MSNRAIKHGVSGNNHSERGRELPYLSYCRNDDNKGPMDTHILT